MYEGSATPTTQDDLQTEGSACSYAVAVTLLQTKRLAQS